LLEDAFHRCVEDLSRLLPGFGRNLGIDGTAVKSWSSGIKDEKTGLRSDTDAAWGIREKRKKKDGKLEKVVKKWFGYLVTLIVDCDYELPVGFDVSPANTSEMTKFVEVFDDVVDKHPDLPIEAVMADAGYDSANNCGYVLNKLNALPIIKMRLENGPDAECATSICRCTELGVPICDEGSKMRYAGRDGDYVKWRCPAVLESRDCKCTIDNCSTSEYGRVLKVAIAEDVRRFPGLSRDSHKWKRLYRKRSACERVNARLKNYLLLDEQHVRGKGKVTTQIAMSLLVMLASAISMAKLDKLEDVRRIVALAA
jgi:IS5 family transposase